MSSDNLDIDFIITWVDGNDPEWRAEKEKHIPEKGDSRNRRFRDWDNLQYLFRGIEKYAPWVHKVFFVTCGHYPKWLNLDHQKLELIRHEDYIPHEWLPTFSSRCIDMNFHRIEQLAEHFVYFDDDMFLTNTVKQEDFFKKGLPCDAAIMKVWPSIITGSDEPKWMAPLFDTVLVNRYFNKHEVIRKDLKKWFAPCYRAGLLSSLYLFPHKLFTGFRDPHLPVSYLKSTYADVWAKEESLLSESCSHKFRQPNDLSHWVFRYWQFASGKFAPRSPKIGKKYKTEKEYIPQMVEDIKKQRYKMMCFNDKCKDEDFENTKVMLNIALNYILPDKSSFEL